MPEDMVRAAHVVRGVSQSILDNGRTMLVFEIEDPTNPPPSDPTSGQEWKPTKFAVTIPPEGLKPVRGMITDLINRCEAMKLGAGMIVMHRPSEFEIGNSHLNRGTVILTFNPKAADEIAFLLPNAAGLDLSTAMQRDIIPRLTQEERREFERRQRPNLSPGRPKLILPN